MTVIRIQLIRPTFDHPLIKPHFAPLEWLRVSVVRAEVNWIFNDLFRNLKRVYWICTSLIKVNADFSRICRYLWLEGMDHVIIQIEYLLFFR